MEKAAYLLSFLLFFFCFQYKVESEIAVHRPNNDAESNSLVHVGVVLNLESPVGTMIDMCISMAIRDFYVMHSGYQTRLVLHTRDAEDVVSAASAVLELLKNEEVHTIIVQKRSAEATFLIEIARKAHVPTISFSAMGPSISPTTNPYFIRTAQNYSSQVQAISAMFQKFEWREVVLIYEDTEYGNRIIPHLTDALQKINIRIHKSSIPISAEDDHISTELNALMTKQPRVLLVHMTTALGSRLFALVKKAGMMSEGYTWIITDGLSNSLNTMDPTTIDSMEGVLGIRPRVPESKELENFKMQYYRNFPLLKPNSMASELNIFGLWAYDTIWALAMAVESIRPMNPSLKVNNGKKKRDHANLGISQMGPRLLNELLNTKFKGLSGEFHLVNGQLKQSGYEIFNVIGKGERTVGYWSPDKRISRKLTATENPTHSISKNVYNKITWPGDSTIVPECSAIPNFTRKLTVGVPKKDGFKEFVRIYGHHPKNKTKITGYSIDVFNAVLNELPFPVPCEFTPFVNNETGEQAGSYNDLLYMIDQKKYDIVVGDTTIVANRTSMVDFALPYTESGVTMLVRIRHGKRNSIWIFTMPFTWDLWLTIIMACVFIGLVIRIMERRINTEFDGPPQQQLRMILWFPFQLLAFPDREMVVNNYSKYVMVIWLFMAFILMQSYTACLSSILTVDQLLPTFVSVNEIKNKGLYVGYQKYSFVREMLINQLNFSALMLKPYSSVPEYYEALSGKTKDGGVAAIFDEIPYIKVFLAKHSSEFMLVGPTYRTGGFGFAFPIGSALVPYISRAILNVTENRTLMDNIEKKYFGKTMFDEQAAQIYPDSSSPSLDAHSFAGLFLIAGIATLLVLFGSEGYLWQTPVAVARQYSQRFLSFLDKNIQRFLSSQPTNTPKPTAESAIEEKAIECSSAVDNAENSGEISHQIDEISSREQVHSS